MTQRKQESKDIETGYITKTEQPKKEKKGGANHKGEGT
jgi:hypothetical protein